MDERLKQLLVLGREHYERREYDRAERALRQVLEHTDRYADVFNMLAVICHDRGDFVAAEGFFERAVELNPTYTEALLNLAVTYNDLGKYEAARQVYARVRGAGAGDGGLDPFVRGKIANMHAALAQAYSDAHCRSEAIEQLRKAVDLCPTFADLQTKLGTLYRDDNNLTLARRCYEAARASNPAFVPARVLLGVTLLTLGAADEATAEWREALVIDPENRSAKMYLRMVEAQRSRRGGDLDWGAVTTGAETPPDRDPRRGLRGRDSRRGLPSDPRGQLGGRCRWVRAGRGAPVACARAPGEDVAAARARRAAVLTPWQSCRWGRPPNPRSRLSSPCSARSCAAPSASCAAGASRRPAERRPWRSGSSSGASRSSAVTCRW